MIAKLADMCTSSFASQKGAFVLSIIIIRFISHRWGWWQWHDGM